MTDEHTSPGLPRPTTPDQAPSPLVKLTLPTPPSFSRRRSQASPSVPLAGNKSYSDDSPLQSRPSGMLQCSHSQEVVTDTENKRHSVTFQIPVSGDRRESVSPPAAGGGSQPSPGVYRIPQRSPSYVSSDESTTPPAVASRRVPSGPPALALASPRPQSFSSPLSPFAQSKNSGALSAPLQPNTGSRWASTAAARGLSIAPALAKQRHSTVAAGPHGSIWSATGLGANSGWISPALASARSTGSASRTRGLTVAVMKDGKEMLMETLPTPGLPSTPSLRSPEPTIAEGDETELGAPTVQSPTLGLGSGDTSVRKPKEVILCRYYHTPGLTCTSRPCRFVHDLAAIGLTSASAAEFDMKSPTTTVTLPPTSTFASPNMDDPTSGTFAALQAQAQMKRLSIRDVDEKAIVPGEKVVVSDEVGKATEGVVFLMSGGGKGAGGKNKAKYKTVKCNDYLNGSCPYGEYCSFIHEETSPKESPKSATIKSPTSSAEVKDTTKADRRKSLDPSALRSNPDAWKDVPKSVRSFTGQISPVAILPDAYKQYQRRLSAFAPPYLEVPVEVSTSGSFVHAGQEARKVSVADKKLPLSAREVNAKMSSDLDELARPKSTEPLSALRINAWSKGPPGGVKKVSILDSTGIVRDTLAPPPISAASWLGTESDPATPFDPAVRAQRLAEADRAEGRNEEYPPTASYAPAIPDYHVTYHDGNVHGGHAKSAEWQSMPYPFNAPTYPWGMPMSPVPANGTPSPPSIAGGPGVMWTPAGWAVQDAAMKMALMQAEQAGGQPGKPGKGYWRTKQCKFYSEGECPHGDDCTFIHKESAKVAKPAKSHQSLHHTQPCKFFNSASGCLNGATCAFLHTRVVPDSVPLVERPRPWRTRPCRHFQVGRCLLGNACHFAHVYEQECGGEAGLTEERLAKVLAGARSERRGTRQDDEESEDDIEIVTQDTSLNTTPPQSVVA